VYNTILYKTTPYKLTTSNPKFQSMSAPATASPATVSPATASLAPVSLAPVSLATASRATKVRHDAYRSLYDFEDRRGGKWIVRFGYDSRKPKEQKVQTLKNLRCSYTSDSDKFNDFGFCGRFMHEPTYGKYAGFSCHVLLTERCIPEMVNLINCAGTAPEMFDFLMTVLSSSSTSSVEQSHLSDLAGIVKFVNQIYAKKSEEIPECFQVIDPENFSKFEKIFPPTFGWVRAFCECDRSFSQKIACGDILETCLNNFAQHCTDEIKKKMDESETISLSQEVLVHETEKFLAKSEQVVEDWLATLV